MDPERRAKVLAVIGVGAGSLVMAIAMGLDISPLGGLWPSAPGGEVAAPPTFGFDGSDVDEPADRRARPLARRVGRTEPARPALPVDPGDRSVAPPDDGVAPANEADNLLATAVAAVDDLVADLVAPTVDGLGLPGLVEGLGLDLAEVPLLSLPPRLSDLIGGAGDGNRTRVLSLGS